MKRKIKATIKLSKNLRQIATKGAAAGRTMPKTSVWVGGRTFLSNEAGIFEGILPLSPGYNEIGIYVRDRFGSETRKVLKVVVK